MKLDLTPMAYVALGDNDRDALEARAKSMGVRVQVGRNVRGRYWKVVVSSGSEHVALSGQGPLAAVIAGALDDWQEAMVAA